MIRTHGYSDPATHAMLLLDRARVGAFAEAIARVVRPGDVVLDIGSGSGILALLAARAGASRVYAVERSAAAELIREHARDNACDSIIQVLERDLESLERSDLPVAPNVLVSETLGCFAPEEGNHHLFRVARRLATPDARLVPSSYRLAFCAAELTDLDAELCELENLTGLRLTALANRLRTRPLVSSVPAGQRLGPERESEDIAVDAPLPDEFRAELHVERSGSVNAVVSSFVARLAPGVELSTSPAAEPTHWSQVVFPIHPTLECRAGDRLSFVVRPRIVTDQATYAWELRRGPDVRRGDALRSMLGKRDAFLAQLGLRLKGLRPRPSPRLDAWRAALGGQSDDAIAHMAERVLAAQPGRYADLSDAEQEVRRLLRSAGAL